MARVTVLPVSVDRPQRVSLRPYVFLAALQVADVATTGWILHHWSVRAEGNPIAAAIFDGLGLTIGLAVLLALKLAVVYVLWACQTKVRLVSGLYSLVVANNVLYLVLWLLL